MGENGTGHVDNGTPDHTDTVKGMKWPPVVPPFGITSFELMDPAKVRGAPGFQQFEGKPPRNRLVTA